MPSEEVVTQGNDEEVDFASLAFRRWPNMNKAIGRGPYAVTLNMLAYKELHLFTDMEAAQWFADKHRKTFLSEGVVDLTKGEPIMSTEKVVTRGNSAEVDFVELTKTRWPDCVKICGCGPYAVCLYVDSNKEIYLFTNMKEAQAFADVNRTTSLKEGVVDLSKDESQDLPNGAEVEDQQPPNPRFLGAFFLSKHPRLSGPNITGQIIEQISAKWFYVRLHNREVDTFTCVYRVVHLNTMIDWIFFETAEELQKCVDKTENNLEPAEYRDMIIQLRNETGEAYLECEKILKACSWDFTEAKQRLTTNPPKLPRR